MWFTLSCWTSTKGRWLQNKINYILELIQSTKSDLLGSPTCISKSSPFLKSKSVGIPLLNTSLLNLGFHQD